MHPEHLKTGVFFWCIFALRGVQNAVLVRQKVKKWSIFGTSALKMTILGGQKMTPFLKKGGGSLKIGTPPVLGVFAGTGF